MSATHETDNSLFYDGLLDWLVAGLFALEGLVAVAAGYAVATGADRELAREVVADMQTQSNQVSDAVLVDTIYNMVLWGGVGIAVVGVLFLVAGAAFRHYRRRTRDAGGDLGSTRHAVAVGGSLAIVGSFVPFAWIAGGAIAGHLRAGENATIAGVLAGLVAAAPVLVIAVFPAVGAAAAGAPALGGFLVVVALIVAAIYAATSALGGFVAGLIG